LLADLDRNLNTKHAAYDTMRLRRTILAHPLDHAVESKLLDANPLGEVKVRRSKTVAHQVNRRSVANPVQARSLLRAVEDINDRLVAFFALMYFAAAPRGGRQPAQGQPVHPG
jgi:hypothetical protein